MERAEKRRSARKPTNLPTTFSYVTGTWTTSSGEAVTLDLSARGAQLRARQPMAVGEVVALTLNLDGAPRVDLEARVAWVEKVGAEYRAGVAFRNMGPDQEYRIGRQLAKST
jgi:hypothetical protein